MATPKFKTKRARDKYNSWTPIIAKARRDGVPKTTLDMMIRFQRSWISGGKNQSRLTA